MTKATSWVAIAMCGVLMGTLPSCKKKDKDEDSSADTAAAPPAPPPPEAPPPPDTAATPAPLTGNEVKRYPNETPVGNATVRAVVPFNVYREADLQSERLGGIAAGTFVNVMATYSNWILVEWPSGVGELSPGWAPIPNIYDKRLAQAAEDENPRRKLKRREPRERDDDDKKKVLKKKEKKERREKN
jgi:hypothetical protein